MVESKHRPDKREKVKRGLVTGINLLGILAKTGIIIAGVCVFGGIGLSGVLDGIESKERKEKRERFNRNSK